MNKIKLRRTSIEQTGVVILEDKNGDTRQLPLYSDNPCDEAREVASILGCRVVNVYYSNNLMEFKIQDLIRDFIDANNFLPENFMDEMVMGFPFIFGIENNYCYCYK